MLPSDLLFFFFFNDTATTEIYTLSLHDALPIYCQIPARKSPRCRHRARCFRRLSRRRRNQPRDRKSTRLNSSHGYISYAVFCLKKKIEKDSTDLAEYRYVYVLQRRSNIAAPVLS